MNKNGYVFEELRYFEIALKFYASNRVQIITALSLFRWLQEVTADCKRFQVDMASLCYPLRG